MLTCFLHAPVPAMDGVHDTFVVVGIHTGDVIVRNHMEKQRIGLRVDDTFTAREGAAP